MNKEEQDALIMKGVRWAIQSMEAVHVAGGGVGFLKEIPDDLTATLVRNNLILTYRGPVQ